jgi:NitT/TauT family transport system substrate-binding protein
MRKQLAVTRELVQPAAHIGMIDAAAWKQTEAIMLREKQIQQAVEVEKRLMLKLPTN